MISRRSRTLKHLFFTIQPLSQTRASLLSQDREHRTYRHAKPVKLPALPLPAFRSFLKILKKNMAKISEDRRKLTLG